MPISSFHGLRKNSVPSKPWNSTKSSSQKISPHDSPTRKRSLGVPRLWENDFHEVYGEEPDYAKYFKGNRSPVITYTQRSYGKTPRKSSVNSRPRSARQERTLKRRDTFPKFSREIRSSQRVDESVFRRSKTDPSIISEKNIRKISNNPPRRPTSLWSVGKKEEKSPTKLRRRKVSSIVFTKH